MDLAYIGTIVPWPLTYPPKGWAFCNGTLLNIRTYTALFAILGTRYGGDGTQTFGLPDLRNMIPVGANPTTAGQVQGKDPQPYSLTGVMQNANIPPHNHTATVSVGGITGTTTIEIGTGATGGQVIAGDGARLSGSQSNLQSAAGVYLPPTATPVKPVNLGGATTTLSTSGASVTVGQSAAATQAVVVSSSVTAPMPAGITTNYIICITGEFPPRN